MINQNNWDSCFYRNDQQAKIAFISFGAEPASNDNGFKELYFVSLTNFDRDEEYFQQTFSDLEDAMTSLNQKYSHWTFIDPENKTASGCRSCEAH